MASRAITLKKRGLTDGSRPTSTLKGSPHSNVLNKKSSAAPKNPFSNTGTPVSDYQHRSSPQVFKVNLDKENNNASPIMSKKLKPSYSAKKHNGNSNHTVSTPKQKTLKSTPSLNASSVLSSSTTALARRHRMSATKANEINSTQDSRKVTRSAKKWQKMDNITPGIPSPYHATSSQRKPVAEVTACASPSLKSVPSDMVKNIVKTIESKPPISPSSKNARKQCFQEKGYSSVRKNLAKELEGGNARKKPRNSFVANLSQSISGEAVPEDFSVTVAVRLRPFSQKEKDADSKQVVFMHENETTVSYGGNEHTFAYDFSFDSFENYSGFKLASQIKVYEKLARPLLSAAFNGYNTCLFAYGQTGSGKSYTIMGNTDDVGVIPRFCDEMFGGVKAITDKDKSVQFHIEMSYFEIYNEKIHDLLVSTQTGPDGEKKKLSLRIREHPENGPYVEGLSTFVVSTFDDIQSWLDVGNQQRVTASTGMNDKSSRSHSVFILNMTRTTVDMLEGERHESSRRSRINLVDLAGSERSSTAQTTGQRLKEGAHINKSLLTLGKVISTLSERSKASSRRQSRIFIPYRDSALTWLLKESLGGNSRTAMIATVSPAHVHMEETLSTLRYAAQARTIVNSVKINEDPNAAIIRELKSEIAKLRAARQSPSVNVEEYQATVREVATLREKLATAEHDKEADIKWRKKLEESEKRKAEEIEELKRAGVSFKVDNHLPNLVNLNEDPQLSELLLYVIRHGTTRIGRKGSPHECEIQLSGALVADVHCEINNKNEVVTVTPKDKNSKLFINGELVEKLTTLHHGDRIVIAGNHFFRLNHPIEVQRKKKIPGSVDEPKKDFEFAKNELIVAQNARMEAEIEQARLQERQEMLKEIELAKQEAQDQMTEQKQQYEKVVTTLKYQLEKDESAIKKLEVIEEENCVLRGEMDSKRRIQEMETKIQPQNMNNEGKNSALANLFAELEAESIKLKQEIERRENDLRNNKEKKDNRHGNSDIGKWSPLRISLLLEEANKISSALKKNTIFSRHDPDVGELQIKVENTKLEIWTLWPMEKFEEKLEGMREAYNSSRNKEEAGDSDTNADSDDNLFYDPADSWREVFNTGTTIQQRRRLSGSGDTPTTSKPQASKRITRRLSSLTIARTSPALQQSLLQFERQQDSSIKRASGDKSLISICRSVVTSIAETSNDSGDSIIDLFLMSLNHLSFTCEELTDRFYGMNKEESNFLQDGQLSMRTTSCVQECFCYARAMQATFTSGSHHKSSGKLIQRILESIKKLCGEIAKLLQGCEMEIDPIVKESSGNIRILIPNLSKYAGVFCLYTKSNINCLNEDKEHLLCRRIKNAFIQGADSSLRKAITDGLSKLKNSGLNNQENKEHKKLIHSALELIKSCKELQLKLSETSLLIREMDFAPSYYQQYFHRAKEMTDTIDCLVEKLLELDTRHSEGKVFDNKEWELTLQNCAKRIAMLSLPQAGLLTAKDEHENSNCNNSNNIHPGEEETERICYVVQDSAQDFIYAVSAYSSKEIGVTSHDRNLATTLMTRTPNHCTKVKSMNMSVKSNAISKSVKKMLELTDQVG